MNIFKKQHTIEYNTIGDDVDNIVVVEQQQNVPTRNRGRRTKQATVLFLSAAVGMLLVTATVVLRGGVHGPTSSITDGLVVASWDPQSECVVPTAYPFPIFAGISTEPGCHDTPFDTCWTAGEGSYCWTRAHLSYPIWYYQQKHMYCSCAPNGNWKYHSAKNMVPNHSCGSACQGIHPPGADDDQMA